MKSTELKELTDKVNQARSAGELDEADRIAGALLAELDNQTTSMEESTRILFRTKMLFSLSITQMFRGNFDRALEQIFQVITLAEEFTLDEILPNAYNIMGCTYTYLSDYGKAFEYLRQALVQYEKAGDSHSIAGVSGNIGTVYVEIGDIPNAMEYFSRALDGHIQLGNNDAVAQIYGNLGVVYGNLLEHDKALEYHNLSYTIHSENGNKHGLAIVTNNIGLCYLNTSNHLKAIEFYSEAISEFMSLGNRYDVARSTAQLGNVYIELADYTKALECYESALSALEEIGDKGYSARVTASIGSVYANKQFEGYSFEKAREYYLNAINLNEELGTKINHYETHQLLAKLYEQESNWQNAYHHIKKYLVLKEEVHHEDTFKQTRLMDYRRKIEESERDRQVKLARFQEQEKILHNILPAQIAERMVQGETTIAESYQQVSVFFSDIVSFTELSQSVTAEELVALLNGIFSHFDQLARKHGLEKIKTIGDAYMAVAGAPVRVEDHAARAASFAVDVANFMENYRTPSGEKIGLRIGLHTGSVVAGIIGENKFAYDLWGDAVNTASRMESYGEAGKIHCSVEFMNALSLSSFQFLQFQERGEIEVKGKGLMKTYFLEKV